MAQITELKHEEKTRRRTTRAVAVVGATLVVCGASWFAVAQLHTSSDPAPTDPLSTPSAPPVVNLEPGATVGTRMTPSLEARAPDSWGVFKDGRYVNLGGPGETNGMFIEIDGPVLQVFDPRQNSGTSIPSDGYATWLRENPGLSVVDDRMVAVDGQRFPQVTVKVARAPDAVPDGQGVTLAKYNDFSDEAWQGFVKGTVVTQTVINVGGKTMVVSAYGAVNDAEQAELAAALDVVTSTMKLPG